MKKESLIIGIVVLLLTIGFSGCLEETNTTPTVKLKTIYVDDSGDKHYKDIQSAINAASPGDTVYVYNGTYYENILINIVINKTINLIGEDKSITIINSRGYGNALYISANHVNISGFTIQGRDKVGDAGIEIHSDYNSITNSTITNNWIGISIADSSNNVISSNTILNSSEYGIYLWNSNYNIISSNTINNNSEYGIYSWNSNYNIISSNTINNNSEYGIKFNEYSSYNTISVNTIDNTRYGIGFSDSYNNTVFDSTITNNRIGISIVNSSNNDISSNIIINNSFYGIYNILKSNNNIISSNTIINNRDYGLYFLNSSNNIISSNTINNNSYYGIYFDHSNNNTIYDNTIIKNRDYGINILTSSYNNILYHNILIDNTQNAQDTGNNIWYNKTLMEGNYWEDYTGTDANRDGIGDTPYTIKGVNNQDKYPLMNPIDI